MLLSPFPSLKSPYYGFNLKDVLITVIVSFTQHLQAGYIVMIIYSHINFVGSKLDIVMINNVILPSIMILLYSDKGIQGIKSFKGTHHFGYLDMDKQEEFVSGNASQDEILLLY